MDRSQKAAVIEAIKGRADNASFAVLTDFKGMTVEELTSLRDSLRKAGGEYYVVKNTLARIAFTGGPHDVVKDKFHENCAIARVNSPRRASSSPCALLALKARK